MSFVGVDAQGHRVAAFAVAPPMERFDPPGLGLALHVEPAAMEAAKLAVELARRMAASSSRGPLHTWPSPIEGSAAHRLFTRLGFVKVGEVTEWEVGAMQAIAALQPFWDRLDADELPDSPWRLPDMPLAEADIEAVLRLYERELADPGPMREHVAARLRGQGMDAFDPIFSRVLLRDGRVVGFILTRRLPPSEGDIGEIMGKACVPELQNSGIADLRLMRAALNADPATPERRYHFQTHDRHRATLRLAKRIGATPVRTFVKLRLDPIS